MASAASLRLLSSSLGRRSTTGGGARRESRRGPLSGHRSRDCSALRTCAWLQPAWQWTSARPSLLSRIERLGMLSSCAGQRAIQPPPALRPPRALAIISADTIGRLFVGSHVDGAECVEVEACRLEGFYVGKSIDDAAADLQILRPATLPAPLFERARRDQPALRQALLIEMHGPFLSCVRHGENCHAVNHGR